jgi:hypothetical protein
MRQNNSASTHRTNYESPQTTVGGMFVAADAATLSIRKVREFLTFRPKEEADAAWTPRLTCNGPRII